MEFGVLGPVEVLVAGRAADAGYPRQRAVLAVLLLEMGRVVPPELIIDRVWGEEPPASVRNVLYGYVAKLRAVLAAAADSRVVLGRSAGGYLLRAGEEQLDLHRFRRLVVEAAATGEDAGAVSLLREAMSLWRGPALAGVDSPWLSAMRDTLDAERTSALLDLNDIRLRQGQHRALVCDLASQAKVRSADERLIGQLMLALYRSGRQADALRWFEQTRRQLAEEFGANPGPELRTLHERVLRTDPTLTVPRPPRHRAMPVEAGPGRKRTASLRVSRAPASDVLDRVAAELEAAALEAARRGQLARAAGWLALAAEVSIDQQAAERRRLDALEILVDYGDLADAEALAARLGTAGPSARRSWLLGTVDFLAGRMAAAEEHLTDAWRTRDRDGIAAETCAADAGESDAASACGEAKAHCEAAIRLTILCSSAGRIRQATEWGERAVAVAPTPAWRHAAVSALAIGLCRAGRGIEALERLAVFPDAPADVPLADTDALVLRGIARVLAEDLPGAIADLSVGAARLRGGVPLRTASWCLLSLASAEYRCGAFEITDARDPTRPFSQ